MRICVFCGSAAGWRSEHSDAARELGRALARRGIGTLEELFEAWTWAGLGIHAKPVGVLDVGGYWDPLLQMADRMVAEGYLPGHLRQALLVAREPDALIDALLNHRPTASRWEPASDVKA